MFFIQFDIKYLLMIVTKIEKGQSDPFNEKSAWRDTVDPWPMKRFRISIDYNKRNNDLNRDYVRVRN